MCVKKDRRRTDWSSVFQTAAGIHVSSSGIHRVDHLRDHLAFCWENWRWPNESRYFRSHFGGTMA